MGWAADSWHLLEAKAVLLGVIGRVGGPSRLSDLDTRTFLAFTEGVLRESPPHREALDGLYADAATPAPAAKQTRQERNREIQKALRLFGG